MFRDHLLGFVWLGLAFAVGRLVGGVGAAHRGRVVVPGVGGHAGGRPAVVGSAVVTEVLLAEGCEALLLGNGVDVGTNDEGDDVEEGDPELVGKELLRKGKADGRGDPRNAHHLPEANLDGSANLVVGTGTGDEGHGDQVNAVLDRSDLSWRSATNILRFMAEMRSNSHPFAISLFLLNWFRLSDTIAFLSVSPP